MILTSSSLAGFKGPVVLPSMYKVNDGDSTRVTVMGRTECALKRVETVIPESPRCLTFQALEGMSTPGLWIRGQ